MTMIEARAISYRYGSRHALGEVDLDVAEGSIFGLLGRNGAGKSTLLQILMGLRRPDGGSVEIGGEEVSSMSSTQRAEITYVADGQPLPGSMSLAQLTRYLRPLYPGWDEELARALQQRFHLDPARPIRTLSLGERRQAAFLCALAPRPRLLLLDEPFSGVDVVVKEALVGGLLEAAGPGGWTIVISSHDMGEVEGLVVHVGFLDRGRLTLSASMDTLRERFRRVEVVGQQGGIELPAEPPSGWLSLQQAGARVGFYVKNAGPELEAEVRRCFPDPLRIESRAATLREVFIALSGDVTQPPSFAEAGR